MSYKALYRKYRSQKFSEVVGQDAIVKTLQNALTNNKIAHAYLFSGPRGTGKTSIARLFAKALNCEEGIGHECNTCQNCKLIMEGKHPDVIEIDAASNSGVDEVRNLIDKVRYSPIQSKYKVYIIDEVHMMTNSAFNALLKTLEEPPEYVIFILCTTEPYKLLPTILSRCQRYEFKKIGDDKLKELIKHVLECENSVASEEAIDIIVELANGGARDALSILDQLLAYSGKQIKLEDLQKVFGLVSKENKIHLLELVANANASEVIKYFDTLQQQNTNVQMLNSDLLIILKDVLIYSKTKGTNLLKVLDGEDAKKLVNMFSQEKIVSIIDLLLKCQTEFRYASNPYFLFEIYLLKLISEPTQIIQEVKQVEIKQTPAQGMPRHANPAHFASFSEQAKPVQVTTPQPVVAPKPVKEEIQETKHIDVSSLSDLPPLFPKDDEEEVKETKAVTLASEGDSYSIDKDTMIKLMVIGNKKARQGLIARWKYLDAFKNEKKLGPYAILLKDATPYIVTDKILIVSFNFDRQAAKCNIKENQKGLHEVIKRISQNDLFVYGLNRKTLSNIYQDFLNLQQVKKLPNPNDIGEIEIK